MKVHDAVHAQTGAYLVGHPVVVMARAASWPGHDGVPCLARKIRGGAVGQGGDVSSGLDPDTRYGADNVRSSNHPRKTQSRRFQVPIRSQEWARGCFDTDN